MKNNTPAGHVCPHGGRMRFGLSIGLAVMVTLAALMATVTARAKTYNLTVDPVTVKTDGFSRSGVGFNGKSPGPTLTFTEGEELTINVTNNLAETTSIHWHGLILPYQQDGVPGISYPGIEPGETFTYRFTLQQAGTYWFHSHSGFQEPDGAYGAIVIKPAGREAYRYDRDYVVQLTDAHPHRGNRVFRNLKRMPDYYNRQQRTLGNLLDDFGKSGVDKTLSERAAWGEMRMMPTDIEDFQGFTPLINGQDATGNWTGLFKPGERVRLRFINSSAMTYFDIRIPGLKMTVVQADGNDVRPVSVDEFRLGVAETYDVIVRPDEDQAYSIIAESMGRTALGRGTLAPKEGMTAAIPDLRPAPLLTMADMGMAHGDMADMDHGSDMKGMKHGDMKGMDHGSGMKGMKHGDMKGMDHGSGMKGMNHGDMKGMDHGSGMKGMKHGDMKGMDHGGGMKGMKHGAGKADPFYAPGSGLTPKAANGGKFLSYADLKALKPLYPHRPATREIELQLTGNMERYTWSINGVKYEDAEPIRLKYGERVRFKFVNTTMMTHPMHLHGMWSILDNGSGKWNPVKHVISVAPGTTVYMETEVDAPGQWAFHCHLSYHADSGMFRKVVVEGGPADTAKVEG